MSTTDEQRRAQDAIESAVWDELHRVVAAIRTENAIGMQPDMSITLSRYGGPALVIQEEEITGMQLALLSDLCGQNLDVELFEGRMTIYSASWRPDRIPF